MAKIKIDGLDKLQKSLKKKASLKMVRATVQLNGSGLQTKMQTNADFNRGYQTGTTKRSIGLEIKDGGFTAEVEPTTEYAPYLEYGTRFMVAQPFVRPAFEHQKEQFKKDMKKLVK